MNLNKMINLIRITDQAAGRVFIQFEAGSLPFFRIAWRAGPWGPWMGWN